MKKNHELPEEHNSTGSIKIDPSKPETIPKFVDELPIPKILKPESQGNDYDYYEIEMKRAKHKFHKDFKETEIYGYNGLYPGPTIETMTGHAVQVKWINNLPLKHFLPVDKTVDGAIGNPEVRTVVHLHGANVAPDSDGHPDAWFSRDFKYRGPKYSRQVYEYPNQQQATTLWYHDHALGATRLNVYAGLAGFYLIHDFHEQSLNLPKGKYDIPLMIQDKSFNSDSSLFYPNRPNPPESSVFPSITRRFIGNTMVVNGKVWPYLKVEPRKYRFRILNASNTNGYVFKLLDENLNEQTFWQIGTDGGMLSKTEELTSFPLDPAERIDVIIDFSKLKGQTITLQTVGEALPPAGPGPDVMQFRVELDLKGEKDDSVIPEILRPFEKLHEDMAIKTRRFVLTQDIDIHKRIMLTLNHLGFRHSVTEYPEFDSIEIWEFANHIFNSNFPPNVPPNVSHPIHLHLVQFQILDRQLFNLATFNEEKWIKGDPSDPGIDYIGGPIQPDRSEGGAERSWKDTVRVEPGQLVPDPITGKNIIAGKITRIIVHFNNYTGEYVWHCHILEHEDHDMMRPYRVIKKYCD